MHVTRTRQDSGLRPFSSVGSGAGARRDRWTAGRGPGTFAPALLTGELLVLVAYLVIASVISANPFADALINGSAGATARAARVAAGPAGPAGPHPGMPGGRGSALPQWALQGWGLPEWLVLLWLLTIVALAAGGAYRQRLNQSVWEELPTLSWRAGLALAVVVAGADRLDGPAARNAVAVLGLAGLGSHLAVRIGVVGLLREARATRRSLSRTLVLGGGTLSFKAVELLDAEPELGLLVLGYVDDFPAPLSHGPEGWTYLGQVADLPEVVRRLQIQTVLVGFGAGSDGLSAQALRRLSTAAEPATRRVAASRGRAAVPDVEELLGRPPHPQAETSDAAPRDVIPRDAAPRDAAPRDVGERAGGGDPFPPGAGAPQGRSPQGRSPQGRAPQGRAPQGRAPRPVQVFAVPRLFELGRRPLGQDHVGPIPVVRVRPASRRGPRWLLKRALDVAAAVVALAAVSPLLLVLAVAVRLECGRGSVLVGHPHVGRGAVTVRLWRFRTARPGRGPGAVGRRLRRSWLGRLPVLWNLLVGDLSVVGPRPVTPQASQRLQRMLPHYDHRLQVRGGLVGPGVAAPCLGDPPSDEAVLYDTAYVENWGLWTDATVLMHGLRRLLVRGIAGVLPR